MADLRAEMARTELTRIYREHGQLTNQGVVDESRPEEAALHDRFEWDDAIAGEKYRLVQAGDLIRSVDIIRCNDEGEPVKVRAFCAVRQTVDPSRHGYKPTEEILADPLAGAILLRQFEREMAELKSKYGHLAEFRTLVLRELGGEEAVS